TATLAKCRCLSCPCRCGTVWRARSAVTSAFGARALFTPPTIRQCWRPWGAWKPAARELGVETHMLSAAQAAEKIPEPRRKWVGGLHSVADGKAEPALAAPVLAGGARALGAPIPQNCAVR